MNPEFLIDLIISSIKYASNIKNNVMLKKAIVNSSKNREQK